MKLAALDRLLCNCFPNLVDHDGHDYSLKNSESIVAKAELISPDVSHYAENAKESKILVNVPPGTHPGTTIYVDVPGEDKKIAATVPAGVSKFYVSYEPKKPSMILVDVPPGTHPGTTIYVDVPGEGRKISAKVPAGVSKFYVSYQPRQTPKSETWKPETPSISQGGQKMIRVSVPPGTVAGTTLNVDVPDEPGRTLAAQVPPNVEEFFVTYKPNHAPNSNIMEQPPQLDNQTNYSNSIGNHMHLPGESHNRFNNNQFPSEFGSEVQQMARRFYSSIGNKYPQIDQNNSCNTTNISASMREMDGGTTYPHKEPSRPIWTMGNTREQIYDNIEIGCDNNDSKNNGKDVIMYQNDNSFDTTLALSYKSGANIFL